MPTHYITADLVKVYRQPGGDAELISVVAWGDPVDVESITPEAIKITFSESRNETSGSAIPVKVHGYILRKRKAIDKIIKPISERDVLSIAMVDVQQGDGCVIEMPDGKLLLIDGGENVMFARYLAARFQGTSLEKPKEIDAIIVTHGDADHYAGLSEIEASERHSVHRKRFFMKPLRVFHNGIIKLPGKDSNKKKRADTELLGKTIEKKGQLYIKELYDNWLEVPDGRLNKFFKEWKNCLEAYAAVHGPIEIRRLDSKTSGAFDFLGEKIKVNVLGPITEMVQRQPVLRFLRTPKATPGLNSNKPPIVTEGGYSASHTINGHSIILKFTYGNVRFLFTGDLNEEAEKILVRAAHADAQLFEAEIMKVPHHGSGDFSNEFLEAVKPVVSVVSCGDESEQKDHIHPRATLMGALGKHSRVNRPLVFVTELVAFFKYMGRAQLKKKGTVEFDSFSRSAFGIVHVRTDGKRLLIFTHSSKLKAKEVYAYEVDSIGAIPQPSKIKMI